MLSFFPRGVLDEILNLIESVSEDFPSYSFKLYFLQKIKVKNESVVSWLFKGYQTEDILCISVHTFLKDSDHVLKEFDKTEAEDKCLLLIRKPKSASKQVATIIRTYMQVLWHPYECTTLA